MGILTVIAIITIDVSTKLMKDEMRCVEDIKIAEGYLILVIVLLLAPSKAVLFATTADNKNQGRMHEEIL